MIDKNEEYVKHPYTCAYCGRVYHWSADDLAWAYEASPYMPCGDPWQYRRAVEEDTRIFQVSLTYADDPDFYSVTCYELTEMSTAYPGLYHIVRRPHFIHLAIKDTLTSIHVSVLSQRISKSPSHDNYNQ